MGKKSADIEREIAELRDSIATKIDRVRDRVRDDVKDFSSAAWDDVAERTRIGEHVEKRPMATLAAALGVGVLLGVASDGLLAGAQRGQQPEARTSHNGRREGGVIHTVAGTASGAVGGKLGDELRELLRQVLGEAPGEDARARDLREPAHGDGNGYAGSRRDRAYERGH
ncbi:MAG TPA: hypothetical protein VNM91_11980 [Dehalococcoidia bacterium]|nr:hypothetical protein [Dehalococcoidia bacterium]